jgi:hypothetical protein
MELFIHRQNLLFFQKQLAEKRSLTERLLLLKLLAEEEAKDQQRPKEKYGAGFYSRQPRELP